MRRWITLALTAGCALAATPLSANTLKSVYTTIDLKTCKRLAAGKSARAWACPGLPGYPVLVTQQDRRTFVSIGTRPERRRAARQSLRSVNTLFHRPGGRATLEWRVHGPVGKPEPHATILRYFTGPEGRRGEVIIVMRVDRTQACHVAHIDARAEDAPIAMARHLADFTARDYACIRGPTVSGRKGESPM